MNYKNYALISTLILGFTSISSAMYAEEQQMVKTMEYSMKPASELTELQRHVVHEDGTEPAFNNTYWDNKEPGIYVDIQSGEPLFSSLDKYDSGTGWPSFVKPVTADNIVEKTDYKLFLPRTEVRSKHADSHLGHVFSDGPKERGGMRYCINSAALRFIHKDQLKAEGYDAYTVLFETKE